jgi:hypothetical protein
LRRRPSLWLVTALAKQLGTTLYPTNASPVHNSNPRPLSAQGLNCQVVVVAMDAR